MADRSGGAAGGPARMDTGSDLDLDSHSDPEDTGDTDTGTVSSAGRASAEQQDGDVSAAAAAAAAGGAAEQAPGAFAHEFEGFSCDCCTTEGIDIMCLFADTPTLAHEPSASAEADAAGQRQEPLDNALLDAVFPGLREAFVDADVAALEHMLAEESEEASDLAAQAETALGQTQAQLQRELDGALGLIAAVGQFFLQTLTNTPK